MQRRDAYPPGVPCWIDTAQPDPPAAAAFYGELLGWELEDQVPKDVPGHYFIARLDGATVAAIGSPAEHDPPTPVWSTYVCVEDADAAAARVQQAGGAVVSPPEDVFAAGRMAACADPAGAAFRLWQPRARTGAERVNVPGSWNWSDLNTHDVDGAVRFYGDVFGWEASAPGYGDTLMWRRPGYGDVLAQRDPDIRRRHAEDGVPDGFSDAIGWLAPLPDDAPARAAGWSVTFAVADADAIAETAQRLGGRVVTPPYDAGGVARVTVVADPQGAAFTASQFLGLG